MREVDAGLLSAVIMGERKGMQKWLDRGASLHAVNKRGKTALMLCSNIEILRWLISEGVAIDARDKGGATALFGAAAWHKPQNVRLLLDHGADANARGNSGNTPLMSATCPWPTDTESVETLSLLLNYGADVNAVDEQGKTALIHLLEDDQHDGKDETIATIPHREAAYEEIVRLLLAYNADPGIVDSEGNTALSFSVLRGLHDVVALLK